MCRCPIFAFVLAGPYTRSPAAVFTPRQALFFIAISDQTLHQRNPLVEGDGVHERELTPQPRPNVIFEAGMVMAHFPRRTVIVQVGKIREFTDLAGVHFVRLDNSIQAREELVRRLRIAGCAMVDTTTTVGWHTAGDFGK